jgi:hypothetical protein
MAAIGRGFQRGAEAVLTAFLMVFSLTLLWPVALVRRRL